MTTQYTPKLKLALPVQGELSGTWGDVVNDNITSMLEEAIAGRSVIDSWTTNAHVLTEADGTTAESRSAMLEFTDTGVALTGAATVTCPTSSKIYICKNSSGQQVTITTAAGTGVDIPNGATMLVFCDGTNVVQGTTNVNSLTYQGYTVTFGGNFTTANSFTTAGNFALTLTTTGATDVTLPTTGTLATLDGTETFTNKTFTAPTISSPTLTGSITATDLDISGNTTIGDAAADTLTITATVTSNVTFTDDTYDIGASGATRPRSLYLSQDLVVGDAADITGNATIGGTLGVTGNVAVNTDKVTIDATTGNTAIAGTLGVTGNLTASASLVTDTIAEKTATAGVTIDGVLLKDGGATVTADVNFGDNDKAIFGAGSDLTIQHSTLLGSTLIADELVLEDGLGSNYIHMIKDGAVTAYYDGASRLATTSTGVDVTGTVTADGLTVENASDATITLTDTTNSLSTVLESRNTTASVGTSSTHDFQIRTDDTQRIRLLSNGDISFYDPDGANASFFYDASTQLVVNEDSRDFDFRVESDTNTHMLFVDAGNSRVGIGTNSPQTQLTLQDDGDVTGSLITLKNQYRSGTDTADLMGGLAFSAWRDISPASSYAAAIYAKNTGYPGTEGKLEFATQSNGGTDPYGVYTTMVLTHQGRLGINVDDPNYRLHTSIGYGTSAFFNADNTGYGASNDIIISGGSDATTGLQLKINGPSNSSGESAYIYNQRDGNMYLGTNDTARLTLTNGTAGAIFNDNSNDYDFRVESNNNTHALFVDGANDYVSTGGNGSATTEGSLRVHAKGSNNLNILRSYDQGTGLILSCTSNGGYDALISAMRGNQNLRIESAGNTTLGLYSDLYIYGENGNNDSVFIRFGSDDVVGATTNDRAQIRYYASGNNTGTIELHAKKDAAGTYNHLSANGNSGVIINEGSAGHVDFRVESDNISHMLFVDANDDRVAVNGTPAEAVFTANGSSHITNTYRKQKSYSVPTSTWVDLDWNDSGNPQLNSAYAYEVVLTTAGTGTDTGYRFVVWVGSNLTWNMRVIGLGGLGSNHPKAQIATNKIQIAHDHESTYTIRTDVTATYHGNGEIDPAYFGPKYQLTNKYGTLLGVYNQDPDYPLHINDTTAIQSAGNTTTGGTLRLQSSSTNNSHQYGFISSRQYDHNSEPEGFVIAGGTGASGINQVSVGGGVDEMNVATRTRIYGGAPNVATRGSGNNRLALDVVTSEIVINQNSENWDFRVESDANSHMFNVNAELNAVGVGTSLGASYQAAQQGMLQVRNGGSQTTPSGSGGIEFYAAQVNNGYSHRLCAFDNSGGDTPLLLQRRNNTDTWSTQVTFQGNNNNVDINGALSKNSGSFRIDHPLPAKTNTHWLYHSFIEGPQADLIYRGKVDLVDGSATINIDTASNMTEGTFVLLNGNVQCFTSNETGWTAVKGSVSGNTLTITAQDNTCTDTISWMVVGERIDQHMLDTDWTDANGKVIVEQEKPDYLQSS